LLRLLLVLGSSNPTPRFAINGAVYNVGWKVNSSNNSNGNVYGADSIGWNTNSVNWYQKNLPTSAFPCSAVVTQLMNIVNNINGFSSEQYVTHTLTITLTKTTVSVQKDSLKQTLAY